MVTPVSSAQWHNLDVGACVKDVRKTPGRLRRPRPPAAQRLEAEPPRGDPRVADPKAVDGFAHGDATAPKVFEALRGFLERSVVVVDNLRKQLLVVGERVQSDGFRHGWVPWSGIDSGGRPPGVVSASHPEEATSSLFSRRSQMGATRSPTTHLQPAGFWYNDGHEENHPGIERPVGAGRNRAGVGGRSWREPAPGRNSPEHRHRAGCG